jgi:hypothetical protein
MIVELNNENLATVDCDAGDFLTVRFLAPSKKMYKGAKVFSFESESELVEVEQVTKRCGDMEEAGFKVLGDNMFVEVVDIDEDSESEIEEDSEGEWSDDDDFIVPDDVTVMQKPPDYRHVDKEWNSWRPTSAGARRFKEKVDQIEAYMNHQIDEKFVFKK